MFLLFWIRQQFSSLTASHSWRLFLVVCCLLGVIDATSINRAVFSEKSFCKPCSQSLQSGGGRKDRKEGKDGGKKTRGKESKGRKRKGRKKGRNWRPFIMPVLVLSESPWPR